MRISVVTIAWNDRAGVQKTVESVRSQTWADIEHIVVDGGSSDGTREYLETLDERTQWTSDRDKGRYDAMNKGALAATGDIVWFMNSADVFRSPTSAAFVATHADIPSFRWGYGLSRIVSDGTPIGVGGRVPFDHQRFLLGGRPLPHQATVFTRDFFWELGGYDIDFGLTSDQLFMMKASMAERPTVWAEFLCDFDASGAGSTRGAWAHYSDMRRARKTAGVVVLGNRFVDTVASSLLAVGTIGDRVQRRLVQRATPSTRPVVQGR